MRNNKLMTAGLCAVLLGGMVAFHAFCDTTAVNTDGVASGSTYVVTEASETDDSASSETESGNSASSNSDTVNTVSTESTGSSETTAAASSGTSDSSTSYTSALDTAELFTSRDLEQEADLSEASKITVSDGETVTISTEGVYVITGTASNAQILVNASDEDKVQLVLDGVSITNESIPCIYVQNADKVFVTTTESENTLSVTGTFTADGDTNTDAVIFSRDDVVLNGKGTLNISSTDNGIACKDDLKITGGTINITCTSDALEANDSIIMADGTVTIVTSKDGLHAENDEDNTVGYIYIKGGTLTIEAGDDAIHATTIAQIDGGTLNLTAAEGIEGTWIQINDGTINIEASDDGINAALKSDITTPTAEFNGGTITIAMGAGDTDAIDSNGHLIINGGTIDITAQSAFDYDGSGQYNGGTLIVNGSVTTSIASQMGGGMGGGGHMGGHGGRPGGM